MSATDSAPKRASVLLSHLSSGVVTSSSSSLLHSDMKLEPVRGTSTLNARVYDVEKDPAAIRSAVETAPDKDGFMYTLNHNGVLTRAQRQFYEENGFVVIRKLVSEQELHRYKQHFTKIVNGDVAVPPTMTVMRDVSLKNKRKDDAKGEHLITKIQDFQDDPEIFAYCKTPAVLDYVEAICGPNIKSIHTMLIHKPPNVGASGRHPMHQDLLYFPFRPANRICCAWTAMELIDRDNGCLSVVPGTHVGRLEPHDYPNWNGMVNKAYYGIAHIKNLDRRVHLRMEAGDTVFFHPNLFHGSGANKTQRFRKAISCHYASADCSYIDTTNTVQHKVGREVVGMVKRRFGIEVEFADVWRAKSRLLRGRPGTLDE
jgi:phytanoyl-CoA hydroxylase